MKQQQTDRKAKTQPPRRHSAQEAMFKALRDEILEDFQNPENPYNPKMDLEHQAHLVLTSLMITTRFLESKEAENVTYEDLDMCTSMLSSALECLLAIDLPGMARHYDTVRKGAKAATKKAA